MPGTGCMRIIRRDFCRWWKGSWRLGDRAGPQGTRRGRLLDATVQTSALNLTDNVRKEPIATALLMIPLAGRKLKPVACDGPLRGRGACVPHLPESPARHAFVGGVCRPSRASGRGCLRGDVHTFPATVTVLRAAGFGAAICRNNSSPAHANIFVAVAVAVAGGQRVAPLSRPVEPRLRRRFGHFLNNTADLRQPRTAAAKTAYFLNSGGVARHQGFHRSVGAVAHPARHPKLLGFVDH